MSQISKTPTGYKTYYKKFVESNKAKLAQAREKLEKDISYNKVLRQEIISNKEEYKTNLNIDLESSSEFKKDEYINGKLFNVVKSIFVSQNVETFDDKSLLYTIYKYAKTLEDIKTLTNNIRIYKKCLEVKQSEYKDYLFIFANELHKQMILNGKGFAFPGDIGWICINRVKVNEKGRLKIDYAATKKNKEKLLAEGVELYDREKHEWCAKRGLPYNGVDWRVYNKKEYIYEIPLIHCTLPNGNKFKFKSAEFVQEKYKQMSYDDMIEYCHGNKEEICKLPISIKKKITLCNKVDKTLYLNFIRNEAQETHASSKISRKNRQRL